MSTSSGDPLDLTDLYAFTTFTGDRTVLIVNVNPDFGEQADALHPDAVYRINVDTDGDNQADIAFSVVFSPPVDGAQTATVYRATGEQARAHEAAGEAIITDAPVSFGPDPQVIEAGPYRFYACLRSDPFFVDLDGVINDFQWTGVDAMADKNVFGIVLELPHAELGPDR